MKTWEGRFKKKMDKLAEDFSRSFSFDKRLFKYEIRQSIAQIMMLKKCKVIPAKDANKVVQGLKEILREGVERLNKNSEDIHTAIENRLIEKVGKIGGALPTARSRNDQVVTDLRMYLKEEIKKIRNKILKLQEVLLNLAEENIDIIMPGFTHLQPAQPVLLSHYLLAYFNMFQRDLERYIESYKRCDVLPLGSGALAGVTFPIDREYLAKELGFSKTSSNSIDAVGERDFVIEFISTSSILMMHLSRLCEELVIFSTGRFNFLEIDEAFSTGSSIMPQKKNPDLAEMIRGKTGRVYGNLMGILTVMKGLPLSYNRDLQEDKEGLFDTVDTVKDCLTVLAEMLSKVKFNQERMLQSCQEGFLNATDAADYLVSKGVPFRLAHKIVGKLVIYCLKKDKSLEELNLSEFKRFSPHFAQDIKEKIRIESCISSRKSSGGTAWKQVRKELRRCRKSISLNSKYQSPNAK